MPPSSNPWPGEPRYWARRDVTLQPAWASPRLDWGYEMVPLIDGRSISFGHHRPAAAPDRLPANNKYELPYSLQAPFPTQVAVSCLDSKKRSREHPQREKRLGTFCRGIWPQHHTYSTLNTPARCSCGRKQSLDLWRHVSQINLSGSAGQRVGPGAFPGEMDRHETCDVP